MLKFNLLILLYVFLFLSADAQQWKRRRYEISAGIGGTNFLGELGGANREGTHFINDLELSMTRPLADISFRYQIRPHYTAKGTLTFGILRGNDNTTKEVYRNYRNLSFRSSIIELSSQIEYWPIREKLKLNRYSTKRRKNLLTLIETTKSKLYPYVFIGVGVFYFNPKAYYHGKWYALQPLGTEGQGLIPTRKKYKRIQIAIPVGFGCKYPINRKFLIGFEYGIRKTFSDYIDDVSTTYYDQKLLTKGRSTIAASLADRSDPDNPDVSRLQKSHASWTAPNQQRGDSRYKDSYMFLSINIIYKFGRKIKGIPRF